jgi:SNF2 family DNA or RNA helicase
VGKGGCILADEVGLGKTIEAGLVIAQTRAEGAHRILLIVPKSLIGQWQNELANLFGIQAQDEQRSFVAPGLVLLNWQIGNRIRRDILQEAREEYGDQIVSTLSRQFPMPSLCRRIFGYDEARKYTLCPPNPTRLLFVQRKRTK